MKSLKLDPALPKPVDFDILYVYCLAAIIPSLAVTVRRLHDTGRGGWWILIGLISLVGQVWLLVFLCTAGEPDGNKWGADPKD